MESLSDIPPTNLIIGPSLELLHVAKVLGQRGERIALMSRTEIRLNQFRTELAEAGLDCAVFPVDVTDPGAVLTAFTSFSHFSPRLDRMIYNIGVISSEQSVQIPESELHHVMSVNLFGFVNCFQLAQPMFKRGSKGTAIVVSGKPTMENLHVGVSHSVSRAARHIYISALRREVAPDNIRICELLLGMMSEGGMRRELTEKEIISGILHVIDHAVDRYDIGDVFSPENDAAV